MVLEALIMPKQAEKKPFFMIILGLLYSSVAVLLSLWIFKEEASLIMVFLTVLACMPLVYNTIKFEESKDVSTPMRGVMIKESRLLKEHSKALMLFIALFIGCVIAFSIWFVFLPNDTVQNLFSTQLETITAINNQVSGEAASNIGFLTAIISNNLKVLFFCILFSFFYGAGAIFILTWNASVISAAIGTFVRNNLEVYAQHFGLIKIAGYFHIFSLGLLRYMTHGVLEILAYFIGGLAGGIISVAVIRHDIRSREFRKVLMDSTDLIILAVIVVIISGLVEVFVTPKIV